MAFGKATMGLSLGVKMDAGWCHMTHGTEKLLDKRTVAFPGMVCVVSLDKTTLSSQWFLIKYRLSWCSVNRKFQQWLLLSNLWLSVRACKDNGRRKERKERDTDKAFLSKLSWPWPLLFMIIDSKSLLYPQLWPSYHTWQGGKWIYIIERFYLQTYAAF